MTADQLVRMDALLERLAEGDALVIAPDGTAHVGRWVPRSYTSDVYVRFAWDQRPPVPRPPRTWHIAHAGRWLTGSFLGSMGGGDLIELVFHLTPSDGPSLTPTA